MILYNMRPNNKKNTVATVFCIIIPIVLLAAAIVETVLLIKLVYPQLGDGTWFFIFASYAVYIVLGIISLVILVKIKDKNAPQITVHSVGIGFCECGYFFELADISYQIDGNSIKTSYNENESGTKTSAETYGTISVNATCRHCYKTANVRISGVKLGSASESYTRKWFTTDPGVTFTHKSSSSAIGQNEMERLVIQRYQSDLARARKTIAHFKSLGYYDPNNQEEAARAQQNRTQNTTNNNRN